MQPSYRVKRIRQMSPMYRNKDVDVSRRLFIAVISIHA
jgi:hypothetical protein